MDDAAVVAAAVDDGNGGSAGDGDGDGACTLAENAMAGNEEETTDTKAARIRMSMRDVTSLMNMQQRGLFLEKRRRW